MFLVAILMKRLQMRQQQAEEDYRLVFFIHTLQEYESREGYEKLQELMERFSLESKRNKESYQLGEFNDKKEREKKANNIAEFIATVIYLARSSQERFFLELMEIARLSAIYDEEFLKEMSLHNRDSTKNYVKEKLSIEQLNELMKQQYRALISIVQDKVNHYIDYLQDVINTLTKLLERNAAMIRDIKEEAADDIIGVLSKLPEMGGEYDEIRRELIADAKEMVNDPNSSFDKFSKKFEERKEKLEKHLQEKHPEVIHDLQGVQVRNKNRANNIHEYNEKDEHINKVKTELETLLQSQKEYKKLLEQEKQNPSYNYQKISPIILDHHRIDYLEKPVSELVKKLNQSVEQIDPVANKDSENHDANIQPEKKEALDKQASIISKNKFVDQENHVAKDKDKDADCNKAIAQNKQQVAEDKKEISESKGATAEHIDYLKSEKRDEFHEIIQKKKRKSLNDIEEENAGHLLPRPRF